MRKVLSLLLLFALAAGVWFGARWAAHRGEIKATIVVDDAGGLKRGDPVVESDVEVGRIVRVDRVDDRTALTVRLSREHRRAIVTDSLFAVEKHRLVVENTFAAGQPVEDGAVIHAKQDRFTVWLARHGKSVRPYIDKVRARADQFIDRDFAEWTAKAPEWRKEGSDSVSRHIEEVKQRVAAAEAKLKSEDRAEEAAKLKARFEQWVHEATR